ncbi:hypothetical protein HK405_000193 [Cladochytrium tenue]|nr:hypothetical protein HK405_000193 [Cladochytrium tenue]
MQSGYGGGAATRPRAPRPTRPAYGTDEAFHSALWRWHVAEHAAAAASKAAAHEGDSGANSTAAATPPPSTAGVVYVAAPKFLGNALQSVLLLRQRGCSLPMSIAYVGAEFGPNEINKIL